MNLTSYATTGAQSDALVDLVTDPRSDLSAFISPERAAVVLIHAGRILRRVGWHQGATSPLTRSREADRPVCAIGAINLAAGADTPDYHVDLGALAVFARYLTPDGDLEPVEQIAAWNDDNARTAADIISALEKAARTSRTLVTPPSEA